MEKLLVKFNLVTSSCIDSKGNRLAIPILDSIREIDGEVYGDLIGFQDDSGNEVGEEIIRIIVDKLKASIN